MEEKETCSFCSVKKDAKDLIIRRDKEGMAVVLCRACAAVAARTFGFRNLNTDKMKEADGHIEGSSSIQIKTPVQIFTELKRYVIGQDPYH